jgi:hypothetical protein
MTTVSLLKAHGSTSGLKHPLELLESSIYLYNSFKGGHDGRGYRNMYEIQGPICRVLLSAPPPCLKIFPRAEQDLRRRAEMMPLKP